MDYGKQGNPIIEQWMKYPEWRSEFIRFLMDSYGSLLKRLEEESIKVGLTDPD